jgi:hypothetical protein
VKLEGEFDMKDEDTVVISDYFINEKGIGFKTEAFYCTKISQVKGILTLSTNYMKFDPIECPENDIFVLLFISLILGNYRKKAAKYLSSRLYSITGIWSLLKPSS